MRFIQCYNKVCGSVNFNICLKDFEIYIHNITLKKKTNKKTILAYRNMFKMLMIAMPYLWKIQNA